MAKVRILLEAGQENASAVGDIQGWEELYDFYALRNPNTTGGPTFAQGSYKDTFQLTGTFPGGWTADALGSEEIGEFQTANCAGTAVQMVKQAVFYNPTPTYLTYDKSTSDYPGRFRLSGSSQLPHRVTTDMMSQAGGIVKTLTAFSGDAFTADGHGLEVNDYVTFGISAAGGVGGLIFGDRTYQVREKTTNTFKVKEWPSGDNVTGSGTVTGIKVAQVFPMTITRHRTNTTHTAVPGGVIDRTNGSPFVLNVEPPLDPLPQENEVFDHELVLMATAGVTSDTPAFVLNRQYGGDRDGGSSLDSSTHLETRVGFENRGANVPATLRLTTTATQIRPGMRISGLTTSSGLSLKGRVINSGLSSASQQIALNGDGVLVVGDQGAHTIQENERIRLESDDAFPSGLASSTDYFALTVYRSFATATITALASAHYINLGTNNDDRIYFPDEEVQIIKDPAGTLPSNLSENTTYYAKQVVSGSNQGLALATEPGGTQISFGASLGSGTHQIRRMKSMRLAASNGSTTAIDFDPSTITETKFTVIRTQVQCSSDHNLFTGQDLKATTTAVNLPGGIASGQELFAIRHSSDRFSVASSQSNALAGTSMTLTAAPTSGLFEVVAKPVPEILQSSLYVTRLADPGESKTYTLGSDLIIKSDNVLQTTNANHLYVQDERLQFAGNDRPTGLVANTDYYVQPVSETEFKLASMPELQASVVVGSANWTLTRKVVNLSVNDAVKASSTAGFVPTNFVAGQTYYVKTITTNASGFVVLTLSATEGGDPILVGGLPSLGVARLGGDTVTVSAASGSGSLTIERLDSYCSYYVADEVGGEDLSVSSTDTVDNSVGFTTTRMSQFSGYFNGLQLRCSSGTANNLNKTVMLKHVQLDTSGDATVSRLHWSGAWPASPQEGDKFVIEPPPVSGSAVPFDQFCKILPWSPFEGRSAGQGTPYAVTLASTNTVTGTGSLTEFMKNAAVQFFTTGTLPNNLVPGKTYFLVSYDQSNGTFTYSATYGGTAIAHEVVSTEHGTHYMVCVDALGKDNPFPPGFNYPGQYSVPQVYQHDRGQRSRPGVEISSGITTALRMATHYGEPILHINCAFPGSTIQHREIGTEAGVGFGHYDPARQVSWSKGEPDGCFARLEAVLAGVKRALDEQGDTGEVELVTWMQGEEEAKSTTLSDNYKASLRQLKKDLREAIVSAGLSTKAAERIPFVQALVREKHTTPTALDGTAVLRTSAAAVNTAIKAVADEDPHSRYVDLTNVSTNFESDLGRTEYIRYSGVGMDYLGKSLFAAWESLKVEPAYSEVQICNLALANLGDRASITAFRPSDGSRQADLCAQFYDLALNGVLQQHPWDFSIRRTSPTKATTDRTEWLYSFFLPDDFVGVLAVLPKEPKDDVCYMGKHTPLEYAIELDANYTRRIYCNQDDVVLRYHAKVTDPHYYSEMFVQALSWKLATLLAGPLIKGEAGVAAAQRSMQMFQFMMQQATAFDATKTRERKLETYKLAEFDYDRGESGELSDWDRNR